MKKIILLQLIIFSSIIANCQWQQLPQFTNAGLQQIQFVDENTGWIKASKYMNPDFIGIIFRTIDGGQTWDSTLFDHTIGDIYFIDSDIGYATGADSLMITTDGGISWTYYPSSIEVENMSFINADTGWTTNSTGVVKTVDGGNTWSEILAVNPATYVSSLFLINGDIGYVSTYNGDAPSYGFYYTNDGGLIWTNNPISFRCTDFQMFISGFGYGIENNSFMDLFYSSFHKTNDHGTSWDEIPTPIPEYEFFNDLYFTDENNGWISISTSHLGLEGDGGIYYTSDGGQSWVEQLNKPVSDFSFIDENTGWALRRFFNPDSSDYVYRTVNGGVGINEHTTYKDELNLFPNPTNNMVTLNFELSQEENISLSIHNINGQEIMQIPVGSKKIGNYKLNCSDLMPGIYFVTLKTDSKILTKKLLIE